MIEDTVRRKADKSAFLGNKKKQAVTKIKAMIVLRAIATLVRYMQSVLRKSVAHHEWPSVLDHNQRILDDPKETKYNACFDVSINICENRASFVHKFMICGGSSSSGDHREASSAA